MKDYIRYSNQIDPMYHGNKYIERVDLVQHETEEPIPHVHVLMKNGKVSYIRLDKPEYLPHHEECYKLDLSEKCELEQFFKKESPKLYMTSLTEDTIRQATNYEFSVDRWIITYGDEEMFELDEHGYPIQPNYIDLW